MIVKNTEAIRRFIADEIKSSGCTQSWLCKQTGLSMSVVSKYLNGDAGFALKNIIKLLSLFGYSLKLEKTGTNTAANAPLMKNKSWRLHGPSKDES